MGNGAGAKTSLSMLSKLFDATQKGVSQLVHHPKGNVDKDYGRRDEGGYCE